MESAHNPAKPQTTSSTRWRRGASVAMRWISGYFLLTLFLWPLLAGMSQAIYTQQTGRQLQFDMAGFNPFTLSLFFYGLEDKNADGSTLWAADEITVNPSLLGSLWHRAGVFDAIYLHGLTVAPAKVEPQRYNFSDILAHRSQLPDGGKDAGDAPATIPRLLIHHFSLQAHLVQYTDRARHRPAQSGLRDIAFVLNEFSTIDQDGDGYSLFAEGVGGGRLAWQGDLSVPGQRTWGRLAVSDLQLKPLWEFLEPELAFVLNSGQLNLSGEYDLSWRDGVTWSLAAGLLELNEIAAQSKDNTRPSRLVFDQLQVALEQVHSGERNATIQNVTLRGLSVHSWHMGAEVGLVQMFTPRASGNDVDDETTDQSQATPWRWTIVNQHLDRAEIHWQVPELAQRQIKLAPVNIRVTNLNSGDAPADLQLSFLIDDKARVAGHGQWQTAPQNLVLTTAIDQLPLPWLNPLLADYLALELATGELSTEQTLTVKNATPTTLNGKLQLSNVAAHNSRGTQLASFSDFIANDLALNFNERSARLARVQFEDLIGSLHIREDGTTNLHELLKKNQPQDLPEQDAAEATPAAPVEAETAPAWRWQLDELALVNTTLDFRDDTPLTPFSARIRNFSGAARPISSEPAQAFKVDFAGNVDGYAPVTLKGWAKPLLTDPAMDLSLKFSAMDLGVFNPYSTTFTGWHIEKGLLSVELDYQLDSKRVVGNNRVVLDQLELGDRINTKRLIDLPLRLALALLTDENGVADLSVPVSGTTDDPDFSVASVVWGAVRNSIMKLVTAPFKLLASLVGSEKNLGTINFAASESQISPTAEQKLIELHAALQQRPSLRLGIVADVSKAEIQAMSAASLAAALNERGVDEASLAERDASWQRAALALLAERNVEIPQQPSTDALQQALLESQQPPQAAMQSLAESRALQTKQYLLDTLQLDPTRVFVRSRTLNCKKDKHCQAAQVRFEISS